MPVWWSRMLQDLHFRDHLKCRWHELRQNILSDTAITNWIDTTAAYLNEAQTRNFIIWPILGIYVWPNPSPIPATYAGEITSLKNWIIARLNFLDSYMPGNLSSCLLTGIPGDPYNFSFSIYPNPATNQLTVMSSEFGEKIGRVEIYNVVG